MKLREEAEFEFENEENRFNLNLSEKHLEYYSMVSEYLFLKAMIRAKDLSLKYKYKHEEGKFQFQDIWLLDLEEMQEISSAEHLRSLEIEKKRAQNEQQKTKNKGKFICLSL